MNRQDRQITDIKQIIDILTRCDTLSIGFNTHDYPYVVAVSFGVLVKDNDTVIYFHGAKKGYKTDLISQNPKVCVEGHIFHKTEQTQNGITTRYESIIGFGTVEKVYGSEIILGLKSIIEHYNFEDYSVEDCEQLDFTAVYKITLESITGKRNIT